MALGNRLTLVVTCLTLVSGPCRAQSDNCFMSTNIVGAVLGTFFSTAVLLILIAFLLWWIYYRRRSPNGVDRQSKGSPVVESGSGFDNPCFEANPNSDAVDGYSKSEELGHKDQKTTTSWTPLRFFGTSKNEKKRSLDDSFVSEPERVSVQLRGHDFTGLGFNVTGNMRDGIFIKDILNRGPASESGKISPGDRILNVTISFRHVVYEDALTILSYASPYDVTLELEKGLRNSSNTLKKRKAASTVSLASNSPSVAISATPGSVQPEGPPNERLVHPLYRSQSIDDLSKVGRTDAIIRADMRIPNLADRLSGGLAKSKLVAKANFEIDMPSASERKIKTSKQTPTNVALVAGDITVAPPDVSLALDAKPSKISKFAIKVLPDFKFKNNPKNTDLGLTKLPTGLDMPEAELNLPKVEIHVPKTSEVAVDIDVPDCAALPTPNVAIDIPDQNFSATAIPNVSTDIRLNMEIPSAAVALTESDLKLKQPKIDTSNIDVNLPNLPGLELGVVQPSLPDVTVSQETPNLEISLDTGKATKSGFHIKFPKLGGSKASKVDVPDLGVNVSAPEVDVSLPDSTFETDTKVKKEGTKSGFEFKMPKLSLKKKPEISVDTKEVLGAQLPEAEIGIKLPDTSLTVVPESSLDVKIPEASLEIQPPSLGSTAIDMEVSPVSSEVKKPKLGFSMPKFNIGKVQTEQKDNAAISIESSAQIGLPQVILSDDDEEGKKKMKFGKIPKIGATKPQVHLSAAIPDVSAEVEAPSVQVNVGDLEKADAKSKSKFGFKLPKIGGNAAPPEVSVPQEHNLKLSSVEIKTESSDSSSSEDEPETGGKKKKKFSIKMPKFGLSKPEVECNAQPNGAEAVTSSLPEIKTLEGSLEIGVPNINTDVLRMQSDSEDSSQEEDGETKKKKSKSLKLKSPEIQISSGIKSPSFALPLTAIEDVPKADISFDVQSTSLSGSTHTEEFGTKLPNVELPNVEATSVSIPHIEGDVTLPSLPDVAISQETPSQEISVDLNKTAKSGFHIKFPKFGANKSVKAELPEINISTTASDVEVVLPDASLELDAKVKKEGAKSGFEFKMPKLSLKKKHEVSVDVKPLPVINAQSAEIDVEAKVPDSSIEIPSVSAALPDADVPSVGVEIKKPKLGFTMPKFHMGKGQADLKESVSVTVDAPNAQVEVPHLSATLSDDDEAEGGKKKLKFGKMPKFGLGKPQAHMTVSTSEVSSEVEAPCVQVEVGEVDKTDVKPKSKFGFKLPKIGGSGNVTAPDVSLDLDTSHEHDLKYPNVEAKIETDDSSSSDDEEESGKKKKSFSIKIPKFGLSKADTELGAPSVVEAVNISLPDAKQTEGNVDIKTPKLNIAMPKISLEHSENIGNEECNEMNKAVAIEIPTTDVNPNISLDAGADVTAKKKGSKFGIKFPRLHVDKPRSRTEADSSSSDSSSSDDEDERKVKIKSSKTTSSVDHTKLDSSLHGNIDVPSSQAEFDVSLPKVDLDAEIRDDEIDEEEIKKKSSKFGFSLKMPKFHMKKKSLTADLDLDKDVTAQLNVETTSAETDEDRSSEDNHDKKQGKASVKLPKIGFKTHDVDTDLSLRKNLEARVEVTVPKGELSTTHVECQIQDDDKANAGLLFTTPEIKAEKVKLTEFNVDPSIQVEGLASSVDKSKIDLITPSVGAGISGQIYPPSTLDAVAVKPVDLNLQANIELPEVECDLGQGELDEEKKKSSKFFKMPKFHMGKHHGEIKLDHGMKTPEKVEVEANLSTKVDLDANVNLDFSSKDEADSDDEKKESGKKKSRFAIKLPKFQVKHPQSSGSNVEFKSDIDVPQLPNIEANFEAHPESASLGTEISTEVVLPAVRDLPNSIDAELNISEAKVELPEKDTKKKGKFSFKSNFKMPKLHMGKSHVELEIPQAEVSLPKVDIDTSSRGETDDDLECDMEKIKDSKHRSGLSMPNLPSFPIDINIKGESPTLNVDVKRDTRSDESDDDSKDSGKSKLGFMLPTISSKVEIPQITSEFKMGVPELAVPITGGSLDLSEGQLPKESPFIVKMPALSSIKPDVDLDQSLRRQSESSSSSDSSDSEGEESKKGFKLGFKIPQLLKGEKNDSSFEVDSKIETEQTEVDTSLQVGASLPEVEISGKKKNSSGLHFKIPSFSAKADISDASLAEVGVEAAQIQIHGESDTTAEDESQKKSTKIGIKLPKFQTRQRDADIPLPHVELKSETSEDEDNSKEVKIKVKKPKFGIKLPEFNKPKLGVEVPQKEVNVIANVPEIDVQPTTETIRAGIDFPQADLVETSALMPLVDSDISSVDIQVGNIDAEVAKVKAQLAQLQAEFDIQSGKQPGKVDEDISSSSSDSETESQSKSSNMSFGLKLPAFSLGKDKPETEQKIELVAPAVTVKTSSDEIASPSVSSLEVEPVKLESSHGAEKEKKKFSLSLKMPKFQAKSGVTGAEGETGISAKDPEVTTEPKTSKSSIKASKTKLKKKKGHHSSSSSSDSSSDEENTEGHSKHKDSSSSDQLIDMAVKLPRVQVYKNVEYQDAEKGHHDSSSDEEDEVKDIKKNIGARFGVKLKKPKMFSSSKVEITGKNESGNSSGNLQPEWKLPRVDLRRTSKSTDQELSVDVDLDLITEQQKLEQLSPSERAEAIRRDSKSSAGIRLHSPSYISLMPSPRSKKLSLETLDIESSPKLLSVTRLDATPPIETSATMQQPSYSNLELTTTIGGPQVSASQVPSSVLMASDAVKNKRGPPIPAKRSIIEISSTTIHVAQPIVTTDITGKGPLSLAVFENQANEVDTSAAEAFSSGNNPQASDTDISITTSTGSDTLVIGCASPSSSTGQQEAHNRKASSLGDLTRIPTSGSEDGSLERTVSLDFKPVSALTGSSSRAIYNLAVQDLSRVGEDSDEDYNLSRKRPTSEHGSLEGEVATIASHEIESQNLVSPVGLLSSNCTLLTINANDKEDVNISALPSGGDIAETLWFGSTSIQTVESVQTTMSYTQMEESITTDVTLTTTSLGTSPSETSSSSSSSSSEGSPISPASPEPSSETAPNLMELSSQVENGKTQQFHTEVTDISQADLGMSGTRTITLEMTTMSDDSQPQPLTDLNPSAGNFAAVRNRFEQLSGTNLNGAETGGSLGRNSGRLSQTPGAVIKRLSGNFEDLPQSSVSVLQKSFMQHIAPELSEGALSRTVIISSLTLDRTEESSVSPTTGVGPESPVPNLEPPC